MPSYKPPIKTNLGIKFKLIVQFHFEEPPVQTDKDHKETPLQMATNSALLCHLIINQHQVQES